MSRRLLMDVAVCVLLVMLGVASRLVKEWLGLSLPNFHAVAAVSLFAGFYFSARSGMAAKLGAFGAPLATMIASDAALGGYEPPVMVAVYSALLLPAAMGLLAGPRCPALCVPLAMLSTLVFFFATNLAVWFAWYEHDVAALVRCFVQAVPFLKYSLAGDLAFTGALFGVYALATARDQLPQMECGPRRLAP